MKRAIREAKAELMKAGLLKPTDADAIAALALAQFKL